MSVKVVVISFLALLALLGVVGYLIYMNRASEKIVGTMVSAGVVAVAGVIFSVFGDYMDRLLRKIVGTIVSVVAAAVAGIILAFVFGSEPPIDEVFHSIFMYRLDTKMPANLELGRPFTPSLLDPAALFKKQPDLFTDSSDEYGRTLYHHLLQKSFIDWIGLLYSGSWQTEVLTFEGASGRGQYFQPAQPTQPAPSEILKTDQITALMHGNKFAKIHTWIPPKIALPPGAKLTITPPHSGPGIRETGEITVSNKFCTLSIRTEPIAGHRSIGQYRLLTTLSREESEKLWTTIYTVRFKAEFSRLLSGNPEMPKYRKWARQLVDGMRSDFDEQIIWQAVRNNRLFLKATERGETHR